MTTPSNNDWLLIPPCGNLAIARRPLSVVPSGMRIATAPELLAANRGNPFPWGHLAEPHVANRHWKNHRVGVGGLIHDRWFVTTGGRFGGAPNVPQTLPGSLRCCMYLDGGGFPDDALSENEGYAVVREVSNADNELFRQVQLYAAKHVMADGGGIVQSPIGADGVVHVGFVGRCQICPNLELISFPQLCATFPQYSFKLWSEWERWTLNQENGTRATTNGAAV